MLRASMTVVATTGLFLAGCGRASEQAPDAGARPGVVETERGPVSLDGYGATLVGTSELIVDLPSCNGDPVLDALEEDDDEVRIRVVTTVVVSGDGAACADVVEVPLDRPLDDRTVTDLVSGAAIDIVRYRDAGVELDCFDAVYPLEPTFGTVNDRAAAVGPTTAADDAGLPESAVSRDSPCLEAPSPPSPTESRGIPLAPVSPHGPHRDGSPNSSAPTESRHPSELSELFAVARSTVYRDNAQKPTPAATGHDK